MVAWPRSQLVVTVCKVGMAAWLQYPQVVMVSKGLTDEWWQFILASMVSQMREVECGTSRVAQMRSSEFENFE